MTTDNILLVLVAITGSSVLIQLIVLVAILVAVRKAMKSAEEKAEEFRSTVMPVFNSARALITRIEPKIDAAATDLAELTHALQSQAIKLQASADEVAERVTRQAARVDSMTTTVLDRVDQVGGLLNEAIKVPIRQIAGIIAGAKAVIDTLRAPTPPRRAPRPTHAPDDKDMFV